jgi:hypothetical protein
MPRPMPRPKPDHYEYDDPSWRDDDHVVLLGAREWKRKDMKSIGSATIRAGLQSGRARVLRDFMSKDGTLFKPAA